MLNAVKSLKKHATAQEVYSFVKNEHPSVGKGTVYRNLGILSEEEIIRKVEVPDGPDRYDFAHKRHYHIKCIKCGEIFDIDMDEIPNLQNSIKDMHGMKILDYDIFLRAFARCVTRMERRICNGQQSDV